MGEIKRFDFVCEESDEHNLSRDYGPFGQYVRYEDYAALKDESDRLAECYAAIKSGYNEIQSRCESLTVENIHFLKLFRERFYYDENEGAGVGGVKEYAESFMQGDVFTIGCGILLPYEEYEVLAEGEVKLISEPDPLTPATDAYLAEIRSQAVSNKRCGNGECTLTESHFGACSQFGGVSK